MIKIGDTRNIS